jgi:hypothetical protein
VLPFFVSLVVVLTFTVSRFSRFLVCCWQASIIYSKHELENFFRGLNRAILIDGMLKMLNEILFTDSGWLNKNLRKKKKSREDEEDAEVINNLNW